MRIKKRSWVRRSGLLLSTMASLVAPAGKSNLLEITKKAKGCKKSKSPHSRRASAGDDGDDRPPFRDCPLTVALHREMARHLPVSPGRDLLTEAVARSFGIGFAAGTGTTAGAAAQTSKDAEHYSWKTGISTTVFWVGEKPSKNNPTPNHASSWDPKWAKHYGGFDDPDPDARRGFLPASFTPKLNPFYVALPYNDIAKTAHKIEARRIIPWFKRAYQGPCQSVCQNRWIAIRKGKRVCYAQWEDAGPFSTDDGDYVFGEAKPKPNANHDAGLDVSPAVRDYLGLDGDDITDWRFVDFEEIPLGPWADHGENNEFVLNRRQMEKDAVAMASQGRNSRARHSGG